jgi:hypothetical protein
VRARAADVSGPLQGPAAAHGPGRRAGRFSARGQHPGLLGAAGGGRRAHAHGRGRGPGRGGRGVRVRHHLRAGGGPCGDGFRGGRRKRRRTRRRRKRRSESASPTRQGGRRVHPRRAARLCGTAGHVQLALLRQARGSAAAALCRVRSHDASLTMSITRTLACLAAVGGDDPLSCLWWRWFQRGGAFNKREAARVRHSPSSCICTACLACGRESESLRLSRRCVSWISVQQAMPVSSLSVCAYGDTRRPQLLTC